jgi:hypothetical protein
MTATTRRKQERIWMALGIVTVVTVVLFEVIVLGRAALGPDNRMVAPFCHHLSEQEEPRPMHLMAADINALVLPELMLQAEHWRESTIPLWDDRSLLGRPLLAGMAAGAMHPATVLSLVMEPLRAHAWDLALHLCWLGIGMAFWLHRRSQHALPAFLGGVILVLCGFITNHWQAPSILRAASYLPWLLCVAEDIARAPSPRRVGWAALLVGLCLLAGFPHVSVMVLILAGVWFLAQSGALRPKVLLSGALALGLGVGLAAALLLPATAFLQQSTRASGLTEATTPMQPVALLQLLSPRFFGNPVQIVQPAAPSTRDLAQFPTAKRWLNPAGVDDLGDQTMFVGGIGLCLALLGAFQRGLRGDGILRAVGVVALVTAMGLPLFVQFHELVPGLQGGQLFRLVFLLDVVLAALAASALHGLLTNPQFPTRGLLVGGLVLGALGCAVSLPYETWLLPGLDAEASRWFRSVVRADHLHLLWAAAGLVLAWALARRRKTAAAASILVLFAVVDLIVMTREYRPAQDPSGQYEATPGVAWLREQGADTQHRIASFHSTQVLPGTVAQVFGLRSLGGYAGMTLRRTSELLEAVDPLMLETSRRNHGALHAASLDSPILDAAGVRFLVTSVAGQNVLSALGHDLEAAAYVGESERLVIHERPSAMAPAYLVQETVYVEGDKERLMRMSDGSWDPTHTAFVEARDGSPPPGPRSTGSLHSRREGPQRMTFDVECDAPAFLVIAESWYPEWEAQLDGAPVRVQHANHAFMGVEIPAGRHELVLQYAGHRWRRGIMISGMSLLAIAVLLVWRGRSRQTPERQRS